jgi:hypothetical protein
VVRALNGAVFFGFPIASLTLLWANRLLPDTLPERAAVEGWCFALSWLAVAAFACIRPGQPARTTRQLFAVLAILALGLPALNGIVAPQGNLVASLTRGDMTLFGIDLVLLTVGLVCAWRAVARPEARPARERRMQEVSP